MKSHHAAIIDSFHQHCKVITNASLNACVPPAHSAPPELMLKHCEANAAHLPMKGCE